MLEHPGAPGAVEVVAVGEPQRGAERGGELGGCDGEGRGVPAGARQRGVDLVEHGLLGGADRRGRDGVGTGLGGAGVAGVVASDGERDLSSTRCAGVDRAGEGAHAAVEAGARLDHVDRADRLDTAPEGERTSGRAVAERGRCGVDFHGVRGDAEVRGGVPAFG